MVIQILSELGGIQPQGTGSYSAPVTYKVDCNLFRSKYHFQIINCIMHLLNLFDKCSTAGRNLISSGFLYLLSVETLYHEYPRSFHEMCIASYFPAVNEMR